MTSLPRMLVFLSPKWLECRYWTQSCEKGLSKGFILFIPLFVLQNVYIAIFFNLWGRHSQRYLRDSTNNLIIVKLKVPLQVPLKVKVKVKVKVRTWSGHGQVRSGQTLTPTPTQMWDLSYTLKLVSTHSPLTTPSLNECLSELCDTLWHFVTLCDTLWHFVQNN